MTELKLFTAARLTKGQRDEYAALHIMPEGPDRDSRIEAFRKELSDAGIEASLITGDEVGAGQLIEPVESTAYDIFYNYEWEEDTIRVYGERQLRRELWSTFIDHGYYMEEAEALSKDDIDNGSDLLWELIDRSYRDNHRWIEYDVNPVDSKEAYAA